MRFMILVKATKNSEAGVLPSQELLTAMMKYNEELTNAGIMLAGEGLQPSSKGARVKFSGDKRIVIDGPFAETKELIAGFWLWQCKSREDAIEWVKRCPNPMPGEVSEIEIRQVFEAEDFGAEFTPELRKQEQRLRVKSEQQKKRLTDAIVKDVMNVLNYGEDSVSVAIEEVSAGDWAERVYRPDIVENSKHLYKKPGYTM